MPTLSTKPKLTVKKTSSDEMWEVVVKGEIKFNKDEINAMKNGRRYKLRCKLRGSDGGLNGGDDYLFTLEPKRYPKDGQDAQDHYQYAFDQPVSADYLDEDSSVLGFGGGDEIYAKVELVDLSAHSIVHQRNSNQWNGDF